MNRNNLTLENLFYQNVDLYPEKIAIEYGAETITYRELDQRSSVIANLILAKKRKKDAKVGLFVQNRIELITLMLGVLKAGAVFVPFDTSFPVKRLESMVSLVDFDLVFADNATMPVVGELFSKYCTDSVEVEGFSSTARGSKIDNGTSKHFSRSDVEEEKVEGKSQHTDEQVVLSNCSLGRLEIQNLSDEETVSPIIINLHTLTQCFSNELLQSRPEVVNQPDDPIYIYFTSGSTGLPKGILGRSKGLQHFIQWEIETFALDATIRTSQFVTPSFDAFLRDTFVALCVGGTLAIPPDTEILLSAEKLAEWLDVAQVNLIHCVPSLFRLLLSGRLTSGNFSKLRYILMSGERIQPKDLRSWYGIFHGRVQLVNLYGPSETTMVKTFYMIQEEDQDKANIPIGQPMRGSRVLILDENLKPSPKAMVGEIYIRTPYMSLGYYNAPELTRERFIPNPYSNDPNDLLYRTGDLGRMLADGNIELIGRKDYQVKVRGVRVELGDIENQILTHPAVKEAVVVDREGGDGELYLALYYTASSEVSTGEIRKYLQERLPEVLVPALFILLEKMPLTPNGKIDRKGLPEPDWRLHRDVEYVAPRTPTEERLAQIWSELLGITPIGVKDNFFELGGHSLKATRLEARVSQEFNVDIPLKVFFTAPTIAEMAEYIERSQKQVRKDIPVVETRAYYPASFAQKRLYVLNQFMGPNLSYNMPRLYRMKGQLDEGRLVGAINQLIQRQESLRTYFTVVDGEPVQMIHDEVSFTLEYYSNKAIQEIVREFVRPFDFAQAPLFRAGLSKVGEDEYVFLFDMHHIISDQISLMVMMEELVRLYEGEELAPLSLQYKDYSVWQHGLMSAEEMQKQEEFWFKQLHGDLPQLALPTDFQRPTLKGTAGDVYNFTIGRGLTEELIGLASKQGATLYMVLLAAFNLLLAKYAGQEDIIVGTPLAGRPDPALENVVGMFVNTLPMRNQPSASKGFNEFLAEVKENTLAVFDHQEYQMDLLIDKLELSRDMSRNPLFDVMLVLQNEIEKDDVEGRRMGELIIEPYSFDLYRAKFDFILFAIESTEGIHWQFEYSTELFKGETIERMAAHWQNLLRNICQNPEQTLSQIEMLGDKEKEQLLSLSDYKLDYPRAKTIHQLFEEQVQQNPARVALTFEGTEVTYAELNRRANQLAHYLRKQGVGAESKVAGEQGAEAVVTAEGVQDGIVVARMEATSARQADDGKAPAGDCQHSASAKTDDIDTEIAATAERLSNPETIVGLMLKRSIDMVVSMLAILKAGGAYLPIDPETPLDRVQYMLENAEAKLLLTDSVVVKDLPFTALENFANVDDKITITKIRSHIKAFDELPIPDRSLIDLSKYKNKIGMASIANCISLQTSRGCPYHCLYCHKVWSKSHVFRSAENIYNEVEFYYKRGVRNFAILDDCFNLNRENSEHFFKLVIRNGLKVKIFFPNGLRGDLLTKDYIDLMVEAGTVNINLSLETASPRLQKAVKKFLDIDKFRDVMEYIATQHPNVILELASMLGFPTETEEEALQTLQFIQSIKWIHFPYIHVLKVFPNTEMEEFALANGVQKEDILRSVGLAYHELPETLPFPKSFARQYQSRFLNEYFLNPERLKKVLPVQMQIIDPKALIQKYDAYLPIEVTKLEDVLDFAGITDFTLPKCNAEVEVPLIFESSQCNKEVQDGDKTLLTEASQEKGTKKVLLLDLSQHFSSHDMLYNVAEQPLGLLYLLTYLKEQFGSAIDGRIYKSGSDFDSFTELKAIIDEYQPDLIGIRTLSFYREFFHQTISLLRDWGVEAPIITGGPYSTSEYDTILRDRNVDLAIIGEGEYTLKDLISKMFDYDFNLPPVEILQTIEGLAYNETYRSKLDDQFSGAALKLTLPPAPTSASPSISTRKVLLLDHLQENLQSEDDTNPEEQTTAENLAYVMYTSGTTGKPKGIMVEHRQVNNCIFWMQDEFKLDANAVIVQRTNLTFDPSVWEIFWPLYIGGTVKLVSTEQGKDADFLIELMANEQERLTMIYCPASLVTGMVYLLNSSKKETKLHMPWFLIGAEPIRPEVIKNLYNYLEGTVVNTYGPTECTINNTYCYLEKDKDYPVIPIGQPVANNQIHILSKNQELLLQGMVGEICISGESVARGYINNLSKTAESFRPNPFGPGKLYKTGDLGRWLPDGTIEILGRVDDQVKVRGYRIEPAEIEAALIKHTTVKEAVVIVKDPKEKFKEIKACKFCGITSIYPGIIVNHEGVCNICESYNQYEEIAMRYFKTPTDLKNLITEINGDSAREYDLLLLYAGGRGSAYALYQLVDAGLKVLTATYDNGYLSEMDKARIRQITASLGVDHVWLTHPNSDQILAESMQSAHTVCNGCFFASSSLAQNYALQHGIKVVVGATLSRGQIIENKLYKLMKQGISEVTEIERELANLQRNTPDMNRHIFDLINISAIDDGTVYEQIKVLDFYRYYDISNKDMIAYLNERDPYWVKRKNYAIYSTNCAIKQIGDYCHMKDTGYHYYGSATSWEKRLGHLTLENIKEDLTCHVGARAFENFSRLVKYEKPRTTEKLDTKYLCAYVVGREELSFAELREYLLRDLPEYMIPSAFVQLERLPLTVNGKIDRHALPEPEALIQTSALYVAPRDTKETNIARVWGDVLGVAKVGIRDNFIELGGDSIKAIQLASRMNQAGFEVKIRDIFTYQTIEELMPHLSEVADQQIDQGYVTGSLPLTGIQRWFFAAEPEEPYHYNQSVLFELAPVADLGALEGAFNAVIRHHDTLRLNYRPDVMQEERTADGEISLWGELFYNEEYLQSEIKLEFFDLAAESVEEQNRQMEFWGGQLKAGFSLENSMLCKTVIFDLGSRGKRLLITVHHLLIDGISWRILLEDLFTAYQQISEGKTITLPPKTNSFKDWAKGVESYSKSAELAEEIPYWQETLQQIYPLPRDIHGVRENVDGKTQANMPSLSCETAKQASAQGELSEELTHLLLTRSNSTYNTEINDLLLTALARTITTWTGKDNVVITLEGHGREEILPDLNISRAIGWFTSMYPVNLSLSQRKGLGAQITSIKEQLRAIPNKGVGYLILKYITEAPELRHEPEAEGIIFNYLGQFDREVSTELFRVATESTGQDVSPLKKRQHLLEFSGLVHEGRLHFNITYSTGDYTAETIHMLLRDYLQQLETLVEHCTNTEGTYTPADFPLALVTQDYLDKIDKKRVEDIYGLSPLQEGMLYHYLRDPESANYFEQSVFTLEGELDINHLEQAWNFTIQKNEVLRTVFQWKELEKPVQVLYANQPYKLRVHTLRGLDDTALHEAVHRLREEDKAEGFDLEKGPNMRITLIDLGQNRYQIIMSHHHILFDGWCLGLIFREIFTTYLQLREGVSLSQIEKSHPRKNRYRQYIKWLQERSLAKADEFWHTYLKGFAEPTPLPTDYQTNSIVKSVNTETLTIEGEMVQKLERLTKELKITPNIFLQTMWGLLLQRYTNTDDVVIGAVVSGRPAEISGIEEMIGLFINAIPVRIRRNADSKVETLLKVMQAESVTRQEYEYTSLSRIKELSELKNGYTQLFDSLFIFENYPVASSVSEVNPGFKLTGYEAFELTNYDLNIAAINVGDSLKVKFGYNLERFKPETIARLVQHYEHLLIDSLNHPTKRVNDLELLSAQEKEELIYTFNDTFVEYPKTPLIHMLFEQQVDEVPEKVAVVYEGQELTYAELNHRANVLARFLRGKGAGPEEIVGILTDPSLEMAIAVLAVLKAGACFLPIDSRYPDGRIEYMLQDSNAKILLTQEHLAARTTWPVEALVIDKTIKEGVAQQVDGSNLEPVSNSNNLAYIIYTSGSTGLPKGVMIEHHSLVNLTYWYAEYMQICSADRLTRYAGFSFDASISEMFPALAKGAELHIIPERLRLDLPALNAYFESKGITFAFLPTVLAEQFFQLGNTSLRILDVGGDKLKAYQKTRYTLIDSYGPTENTIISTSFIVDKEYANSPIGKPISNTRVYIIGKDGNLQPIGVAGELCVAGANLARGYLHNPDLTAEKFGKDPFHPGERMYHTGDLARWLPDGNIEFLGRIDFQVKIRGFRIDLGEIESQLLQYPEIEQAVVITREDESGLKYLIAYLVAEVKLNITELRSHLSRHLPDYMIPAYFVQLNEFPLTVNEKIDRDALPKPEGGLLASGVAYLPPTNDLEAKLAQIWSEVLGLSRVGIGDNFFALGGHSLKATTVVARLYKALQVEVPVSKIFEYPTIKELASFIEQRTMASSQSTVTDYLTIVRVPDAEHYPVSSAQKRMLVLYQMAKPNTQYNIPAAFVIEGNVDIPRLKGVFATLVERHESLRTSFAVVDGEYVQRIEENVEFIVEEWQGSEVDIATIAQTFIRPFDLAKAPLLRVGLVEMGSNYLFLVDLHHIIADGVSMEILIREFAALYNGQVLPELKVRYRDYAVAENAFLQSETLQKQEAYWLERFQGELPVLSLPTDFPRPAVMDIAGCRLYFTLDKAISSGLSELANQQGGTLYMVLLSIFNILLAKYAGQEDIIIGSPSAGRTHTDLEPVIGMFVNTLVLRNAPVGTKTFGEFLQEVKLNALEAYENQGYQFEMLVEKLQLDRNLNRNPLFDVLFALQNQVGAMRGQLGNSEETLDTLKLTPYSVSHEVAKFDLSLEAHETPTGLSMSLEYKRSLFKEETIQRLASHFTNLVKAVLANPTAKIADLTMLSAHEEEELLRKFNNTAQQYPKEQTIVHMFEAQTAKTPDSIALIHGQSSWTYRELNAKANQLASVLKEKGVKPNQIIAIMVHRSLEMAVGLLAILKSGGAYLPIDPTYPVERINYLLQDSSAELLLTGGHSGEGINFTGEVIILDEGVAELANSTDTHPVTLGTYPAPTDLVYLIYTSGTTGKPKGVMVEHQNMANTLQWAKAEYGMTPETNVMGVLAYVFDAFGLTFYNSLISGAKFVMLKDTEIKDPLIIRAKIKEHQINHLGTTPSLYASLLDCLTPEDAESLQRVQLGGEKLTTKLVEKSKALNPTLEIINEYGPTEHSIVTSIQRNIESGQQITIGKPIANAQVYIFNPYGKLVPVGVIGELCVSGEGLARGYLNRPELTAEKFTLNPYTGERMYRTGDLARWLPDGSIDFIGRIDHQVKIRGYRIELGEIEAEMLTNPRVKEAVVIDREDPSGSTYLTGYYVSNEEISTSDWKAMLGENLPHYMVPAFFIHLEQLPLTINGKIDRNALPEPDWQMVGTEYEAPQTELERMLAQIWSEVLGIESIGINHNFFELGGHSLKATRVSVNIYKECQVEVPLESIFKYPTIKTLAAHIANSKTRTSAKNDNLLLLRRGSENAKNLYFIHDGTGEVSGYIEFCRNLTADYHCWGIQAARSEASTVENLDISTLAKSYIEIIRTIDTEGPYYLAGWSLGGTIAFEMARQLEEAKTQVAFLALIDTIAPEKEFLRKTKEFTIKSELQWIAHTFPELRLPKQSYENIAELWKTVVGELSANEAGIELVKSALSPTMAQAIPDFKEAKVEDLLHYLNKIRSLHRAHAVYAPTERLQTPVTYFKAQETDERVMKNWSRYCAGKLTVHEVSGSHYSIFKGENAVKFAKSFEEVLG